MAQRQFRSDDTDKWVYGYGDGGAGTSYAVPANEGCSGTSGTTSLTLAAAGSFSNGDLVLIHQTRGTGAGAWELNKITSGAGGTSLTMAHSITNTYTDSGASQAQIIELNQYNGLTLGNTTAPSWDGSKGGIIAFIDKGTTTISGTINISGGNASGATKGTGRGFNGGAGGPQSSTSDGYRGEGINSADGAQTYVKDGSAGGGGQRYSDGWGGASGGGGGNGAAGSAGSTANGSYYPGQGGDSAGTASLVTMDFGSGGGGGAGDSYADSVGPGGGGGGGAGILLIISKSLTITGSINLNGGAGGLAPYTSATSRWNSNGGGGAGGSCLIKCQTATLGSNLITAAAGAGGNSGLAAQQTGGNGSVGRIHLDYKTSYTGTTTPTIDVTQDATLDYPATGGAFLYNFV